MSIELDTSTEIDRPIEEVFEYVTTVENNDEWEPRVVDCPPADGEMGVGTTWRPEIEGLVGTSETTMECIAYEPPTKFGYTTPIFGFSRTGDRTRVDWSGVIEMNGLLGLLKPLLARNLRSDVDTSLENLNTQLEASDNAAGPTGD